jgi:signal transduction histidine kinase
MRAKDAANERLEALNVRLAQTLDELSRAQAALLESERLAVQGTMAAAMAHELNTPIAAADSAASAAASAAGDILGYVAKNPSWDPKASAAAAALQEAADGYDPARALTGPDRRSATRSMEKALASALSGLKRSEDKLEELEPVVLASRLVDLGVAEAAARARRVSSAPSVPTGPRQRSPASPRPRLSLPAAWRAPPWPRPMPS